jgi:hypothetical protein
LGEQTLFTDEFAGEATNSTSGFTLYEAVIYRPLLQSCQRIANACRARLSSLSVDRRERETKNFPCHFSQRCAYADADRPACFSSRHFPDIQGKTGDSHAAKVSGTGVEVVETGNFIDRRKTPVRNILNDGIFSTFKNP